MRWLDAAPALGVALLVLLVPGALVVAVSGVRGMLGAALTPVLSVALVAGTAVVAAFVGMPFGVLPLAMATAAAVAVGASSRVVDRRQRQRQRGGRGEADLGVVNAERATVLWGVGGAVLGGAILAVGVAWGMGGPSRWPQTFDALFHLSAVDHVLRTGDGSALTLGSLTTPERTRGFYPAAWHDLAALVASVTGAPVPVVANAVALLAVALIWPLGCASLARVAVGPRPGVVAAAAVLAAGVAASPVVLTSYGTLWPNALATAMLPAVLALAVDLIEVGPVRAAPKVAGAVLLVVAVAGLALAHPNAVVSLAVLGGPALLVGTWGRGVQWRAGALAVGALVAWLVLLSPLFDAQRVSSWPAREGWPQAVGEWLVLGPQRLPVPLLVSLLTAAGCVVAWRNPRLRWLLAVHLTAGALFVVVAGSDSRISRLVSAAWWDDAFRLAALAGVAGIPLAAVGLEAVSRRLAMAVPVPARQRPARVVSAALLAAGAVALVGGVALNQTTRVVHEWYGPDDMLGPRERDLLARVDEVVPAGQRVIGNPWNGAALTGPLADREAVFPHLLGTWGADRDLLASSLSSSPARPDVCAALHRLNVTHVFVGKASFWRTDARRGRYAGLEVAGHDGFAEVARGGTASLWRVTACQS